MSSAASQFVSNLFATLFKDEAAIFQPVADNYLNAIVANPTPETVVAQSLAFQAQAAAVLPQGADVGILDTAKAIKTFIDAQVPSLVAQVTAAAAAQQPTAGTASAGQGDAAGSGDSTTGTGTGSAAAGAAA